MSINLFWGLFKQKVLLSTEHFVFSRTKRTLYEYDRLSHFEKINIWLYYMRLQSSL